VCSTTQQNAINTINTIKRNKNEHNTTQHNQTKHDKTKHHNTTQNKKSQQNKTHHARNAHKSLRTMKDWEVKERPRGVTLKKPVY